MKLGRDEVRMARICVYAFLSDPPWGGSKAGQKGFKESFKDKRLYLECCHSGSGFGKIFQGQGKNRYRKGFSFDEILLQIKCSQQHTDVLSTTHAFIWILSFWLSFFWLNCLLLVIRWAIKGPWASSYSSTTWWVSLLVDQWIPEGKCSQVYGRLRLFRSVSRASKFSVLKLIEIVILWVYYTIPFGFILFWQFRINISYFRNHFHWRRITDEGSLPEMRIWSIL